MKNIDAKKDFLEIELPVSKSISNRLLIIRFLQNAIPEKPFSNSDDTVLLHSILKKIIESQQNENIFTINAHNAGTVMRFLTALLSITTGEWHLECSEQMLKRPVKPLVEALKQLDADIEYIGEIGFPPLKIVGKKLKGGEISIDSNVSSQFVSALMMIAPILENGLTINLKNQAVSKPYIKMTAEIMQKQGVECHFDKNKITIKESQYQQVEYQPESDWSSVSYWYQILAITKKGKFRFKNLYPDSIQGDSVISNIFNDFGVRTEFADNDVFIIKNEERKVDYFQFNFSDNPDLVQTMAVTCCLMNIKFKFLGTKSLRIKETDRIQALNTELNRLGFLVKITENDEIIWNGEKRKLTEKPVVKTYGDHRMALAFAVTEMLGIAELENHEVVSKSYPNFWIEFEKYKTNLDI